MFLVFIALTLGITYWAAKRTKSATDFYAAGRGISALQNGLAMAGDYMSAASFLGIAALVYFNGFYGLNYSVGWLVGWPIMLFLIAERLRNLGKYTFADVAAYRLKREPVRVMAALSALVVVIFYLIGQMVGAGQLLHTLVPQIEYWQSIIIVGVLIIIYVTFGGMKATTWVQIIKAALLLGGATLMALLVLAHFSFSPGAMFAEAVRIHPAHDAIMKSMAPIGSTANPIEAISLGLTLMFGTAGLPHILMRFFTVTDAKAARKSVLYGTCFIGYFYILTFIIGFGAIVFVASDPAFLVDAAKGIALKGGANMPAVYLAQALGGDFFLGFIAAVAFATILAVVSGLTLGRCVGDLARPLCQRHRAWPGERADRGAGFEGGHRRLGHRRDPARPRLRAAERRLYRGAHLLDRRLQQLPDPGAGDVLARADDARGARRRLCRPAGLGASGGAGADGLGQGARHGGSGVPARLPDHHHPAGGGHRRVARVARRQVGGGTQRAARLRGRVYSLADRSWCGRCGEPLTPA